ncbi:MAG TPA: hypothetical protein VEA38_16740 [Terriglobales bacterium]|nr:hypothetical protein [Terriglobales bacterium]
MSRTAIFALFATLLLAPPALATDAQGRISGQVVQVTEGRLVVEEQGPWQGPGTGVVRRTVTVTPQTVVRVVRPTGQWTDNTTPGYDVSAAQPRDIKPGDFVTITAGAARHGAVSVDVVRGEGGEGLALPAQGR